MSRQPVPMFENIDDATAARILELQLQDVEQFEFDAQIQATGQTSRVSDWTATLRLHQIELERGLMAIKDREIVCDLAKAVQQNIRAVEAAKAEERQAESDHAVACRLAGLPVPPPRPEFAPRIQAANPTRARAVPTPAPTSQLGNLAPKSNLDLPANASRSGLPVMRNDPPTSSLRNLLNPGTSTQPRSNFMPPGYRVPEIPTEVRKEPASKVASFNPWALQSAKRSTVSGAIEGSKLNINAQASAATISSGASKVDIPSSVPSPVASANNASPLMKNVLQITAAVHSGTTSSIVSAASTPPSGLGIFKSTFAGHNVQPNVSIKAGHAMISARKRKLDEAGPEEQRSAKRMDTTKRKPGRKTEEPKSVSIHVNVAQEKNSGLITQKRGRETDTIDLTQAKPQATDNANRTTSHSTGSKSAESQTPAPKAKMNAVPERLECVSCGESLDRRLLASVPCKHEYCKTCLTTVVSNALVDEALFPPRCCKKPFTIDTMHHLLTPETILLYHEKRVEFETADRLYCADHNCSAFLRPDTIIDNEAFCPMCYTVTCVLCKGPEHVGECPQDPAIQKLMELAAKEGWKQCGKCSRIIDLKQGCNHITCKCKEEFCYVCGMKWKTCKCPIWEEARLLERANVIVDRGPNPQPAGPARQAQVAAAMHHVQEDHECDQHDWVMVNGECGCDECGDQLRYFIWRCINCDMDACTRCRCNLL